MTAQEIKDLIASKIAGQGSAVDAGSALPEILNAIVEKCMPADLIMDANGLSKGDEISEATSAALRKAAILNYDGELLLKLTTIPDGFYSAVSEQNDNVNIHQLWGSAQVEGESLYGYVIGIGSKFFDNKSHWYFVEFDN